ncbi:zinc finger C-x8-C-x5-C-x3-H type family protein [Actinidia rufa]|uniref:Zinc finger C-x8-C-x5-C-x3-H type family protein n=1 Tax=Actinidia rufa TaxID=165716 RepID=A0A7J0GMA4_9ERIC|nr:zinc finger C-x8-C-x5-C-x3-H type family protein [Actinidia rufa]
MEGSEESHVPKPYTDEEEHIPQQHQQQLGLGLGLNSGFQPSPSLDADPNLDQKVASEDVQTDKINRRVFESARNQRGVSKSIFLEEKEEVIEIERAESEAIEKCIARELDAEEQDRDAKGDSKSEVSADDGNDGDFTRSESEREDDRRWQWEWKCWRRDWAAKEDVKEKEENLEIPEQTDCKFKSDSNVQGGLAHENALSKICIISATGKGTVGPVRPHRDDYTSPHSLFPEWSPNAGVQCLRHNHKAPLICIRRQYFKCQVDSGGGKQATRELKAYSLEKCLLRPIGEYYLRSGGCKFGKACRYNHSIRKTPVAPIVGFNFLGCLSLVVSLYFEAVFHYPDKVKTHSREKRSAPSTCVMGPCKYGSNCIFNHPDPTAVGGGDVHSEYGNGGPVSLQGASQSCHLGRPQEH